MFGPGFQEKAAKCHPIPSSTPQPSPPTRRTPYFSMFYFKFVIVLFVVRDWSWFFVSFTTFATIYYMYHAVGDMHLFFCRWIYITFGLYSSGGSRGGSVGSLEPPLPPPPLRFQISYENEIIWSKDQIISFPWDIYDKWDKISKANPHHFIHMNPLSRWT